ncbi:uncharacterized protein LOC110037457 [Phalaenopsis equestris]|uniref:uncharacterized protein LOC110037457 n=1 Tax=Phalaenopsis equestris TaxID=78828 RepID=UPI0009E247AC|nr:uncharacterized protein LOC110037457 [Phalaenopsis equestris]
MRSGTEIEGGDGKERVQADGVEPAASIIIEVVSDETSCSAVDPLEHTGTEKVKGETKGVDLEKGGGCLETEREKNCRICHLSSELVGSVEEGWELIELGCGCKGELGIAHRRCADAWFRVKGNRLCEICGLNVKSIIGKEDFSFMEVWHDGRRRNGGSNNRNSHYQGSYWTSRRFCSFFVSFLAIAFILQWYFRESFG